MVHNDVDNTKTMSIHHDNNSLMSIAMPLYSMMFVPPARHCKKKTTTKTIMIWYIPQRKLKCSNCLAYSVISGYFNLLI